MNKYRDYDNYLKEYPSVDGYFGKYGGNYLEDPDLIKAFNEYADPRSSSRSFGVSGRISRDVRRRSITA